MNPNIIAVLIVWTFLSFALLFVTQIEPRNWKQALFLYTALLPGAAIYGAIYFIYLVIRDLWNWLGK